MIYIYRLIYFLLKSLLQILKPLFSLKTKTWIDLRSNKDYLKFTPTGSIWFHASSGEIEYCKSVITEIRKMSPQTPIILSYSSPSAEKLFFNIKNQVDLFFPLPWDSPGALEKAILHLKPRIVIFSRTDFWPEFIHQLQKNKIKLAAISMFPHLNFFSRLTYKWFIRSFDLITTVNLQKSLALSEILNREVLTFADSRFDQVFNRLAQPSRIEFAPSTEKRKRIVFASTWSEDEIFIFPALPQILKLGYQIILCPHEVKHATTLLTQLNNYRVTLLSTIADSQNIPADVEILLVDQVGFLADIYRFTDLAFVGGSFKKRIHSVMEPLCSKNVVFFGPLFSNNPEAVETEKIGLTYKVRNSTDIIDFIKAQTPDQLQKNRDFTQVFAEKHRGSSILIAREIMKQI
jgi:3-deoxy-D-manno-octulosonic-acid transferase